MHVGIMSFFIWAFVAVSCVDVREATSRIQKRGCKWGCGIKCGIWPPFCSVECGFQCGRKKRSVNEGLHPFPSSFDTFDKNKDGLMSEQEFLTTLNLDRMTGHAALKMADENGDGKLDRGEYDAAPFIKDDVKQSDPEPSSDEKRYIDDLSAQEDYGE